MVSDEEHRDVAYRLRETLIGGIADPDDVYEALGIYQDCGWFTKSGVERLAELVDRPTTGLSVDEDGRTCCARCGCACLYMGSATCCPDCGAEVVHDG